MTCTPSFVPVWADKLPIYAYVRVSHVWLLDPRLEALVLDSTTHRLLGTWRGDARANISLSGTRELELSALGSVGLLRRRGRTSWG